LRAWIAVDPAVAPGTVPVDALARSVVGVRHGEPLYLRPLRRAVVT
jgi:hypothetical protein